jgi:hypothetical protein
MSEDNEQLEKEEVAAEPAGPELTPNTVVTVLGAGRDVHTRQRRRSAGFRNRRSYRLGGSILIRPGRRVPLRLAVLEPHLDALAQNVANGTLRVLVQNRDVDVEDIAAVFRAEPEEVSSEPQQPSESEEPSQTEETPAEPQETAEEATEAEEPVEEEATEEVLEESADEVEETEPDDESGDGPIPLPEGFESATKRVLKGYFRERGLELPEDTRNDTLVAVLKDYQQTHFGD